MELLVIAVRNRRSFASDFLSSRKCSSSVWKWSGKRQLGVSSTRSTSCSGSFTNWSTFSLLLDTLLRFSSICTSSECCSIWPWPSPTEVSLVSKILASFDCWGTKSSSSSDTELSFRLVDCGSTTLPLSAPRSVSYELYELYELWISLLRTRLIRGEYDRSGSAILNGWPSKKVLTK